jgi:hypothetical protein
MQGWKLILAWIACVLLGAAAGFAIGWVVWKLGFELIGSAIAMVGAGVGGIVLFFWFMNWSEDRRTD